ncbi:hypothetical protein KPL71_004166 [Citrus sinensis]|uniref:Uncharacterized protein n=1 Tax=Citrus sinensis TaxID=2711 RepID=A0ACB8N450_CITSI|nr:hypothetical protein KPL71_004166 [Citrus sinensis]
MNAGFFSGSHQQAAHSSQRARPAWPAAYAASTASSERALAHAAACAQRGQWRALPVQQKRAPVWSVSGDVVTVGWRLNSGGGFWRWRLGKKEKKNMDFRVSWFLSWREAALKRITDTKMEDGTRVCDHVLKMMDYLNEVEIHGVQINDKSKINMVIESLPNTFKEFKKNFIIAENFLEKDSLQGLSRKTGMSKQELGSANCPLREVASQKASVTNVDKRVTGRKIVLRLLKSEAPNGVKPIGCKWIYKSKRGVDGRVETFKARLVVKGFTQKEGIDYEETFSVVAMLKSIRILLSIAAMLDYEIWQMDVKIAFLNGHLEENIYMQQPDGFVQKAKNTWYLLRDRKNKTLALSQAVYIDKILARFSMENSKTGLLPFRHGITFSKDQSPKTSEEIERMRRVPYAEAVGSLMYAMLCTRPDVCFAVWMVYRYQFNPGPQYWNAVEHIIKYLKRTKNYMLVYSGDELILVGYTDSDFMSDKDSRKSTSGYVFTLGSGAIGWRSVKQSCIADSTTEAEYVAASEAAKEAVWLRKFLQDLEVVPVVTAPLKLFCDNSGGNLYNTSLDGFSALDHRILWPECVNIFSMLKMIIRENQSLVTVRDLTSVVVTDRDLTGVVVEDRDLGA